MTGGRLYTTSADVQHHMCNHPAVSYRPVEGHVWLHQSIPYPAAFSGDSIRTLHWNVRSVPAMEHPEENKLADVDNRHSLIPVNLWTALQLMVGPGLHVNVLASEHTWLGTFDVGVFAIEDVD